MKKKNLNDILQSPEDLLAFINDHKYKIRVNEKIVEMLERAYQKLINKEKEMEEEDKDEPGRNQQTRVGN